MDQFFVPPDLLQLELLQVNFPRLPTGAHNKIHLIGVLERATF